MPPSVWPIARVESPEQFESQSDLQLIAAINAGDPAAFEVLYYRYRDWVTGLAHRFTGSEALAVQSLAPHERRKKVKNAPHP